MRTLNSVDKFGEWTAKECGISKREARAVFKEYLRWLKSEMNSVSIPPGLSKEEYESIRPIFKLVHLGSWYVTYDAYAKLPNGLLPKDKVKERQTAHGKIWESIERLKNAEDKKGKASIYWDSNECE